MSQIYRYTVEGNTKPAVQSNEQLQDSIDGVSKSTENLDKNFDKTLKNSEVRIKAIGGSINLLGGAVETVVGSLGLIGIDEEVVKGFQQAAASAIAFADGSKRIFEGFKEITEARKLYQEITQENIRVENANTTALNTNASAATNITSAVGAAQASITQETTATVLNTLSKEQNRIALDATTKAVKDLNDEEIDLLSTQLRALGTNEAQVAATLADARAKGANATATEVLSGATAQLTTQQKFLNIALKAAPWIAVATLVASVVGIISSYSNKTKEATDATIKFDKELVPVLTKAAAKEERLLKVLTDNVKQRGLEAQAIEELKKAYPGFEAFLTRENQLTEQGIAFLKARIELRRAEAGLAAVGEKRIQEEVDLAQKIADLRVEYGFTTQAAKLIAREREESAQRTAFLTEKENEYSEAVNKALLNLIPFNKELNRYAKANAPASIDATDKAVISLDFYNTALKKLNEEQSKRNKLLADEVKLSLGVKDSIEESNKTFIKRQSQFPSIINNTATETKKAYATQALQFQAFIEGLQNDLTEFLSSGAGEAISTGLSTLQNLLSEFGNLQQEAIDIQLGALQRRYQRDLELAGENAKLKEEITRNYEAKELEIQRGALEQQKKLRRAQVVVTTAESVISAYATTATLPPPFGLIAGSILAAAYVGLGNKALENINATNLDSSGTPGGFNNIPSGGGGFSLPGGQGVPAGLPTGGPLPGLGGGRIAGAPTIGTVAEGPIRAYVLAGDVENGVQANIALNNRRRLAG